MYSENLLKIVIISAIVFIIAIAGLVISKANREDEMQTGGANSGSNVDMNIFEASEYDYILMYGDTSLWDDEKNLGIDLDADGTSEEFIISRGVTGDVILKGIRRDASDGRIFETEFWTSGFSDLLPPSLKKGNGINDNCFVQISCCDIDEDEIKEILISAGDKQVANITAIYEYSSIGEMPFKYCGYIETSTVVRYIGGKTIRAYSAGVRDNKYYTYIYDDEKITNITGNN